MGQSPITEEKPSFKDEYDFFDSFPKCEHAHAVQMDNDSYAHATSYVYNLRNCCTQYNTLNTKLDDVRVRTHIDSRNAVWRDGSPCGDGESGGSSACVLDHFARTDHNPLLQIAERDLETEIRRNGPVVATFNVRQDFVDHIHGQKKEPYRVNKHSPSIGTRHATTIVGYGKTSDGKKYWKCIDSNADNDGKFYTYRVLANSMDAFIGNDIKNPVPFKPHIEQRFAFGEKRPVVGIQNLHWGGAFIEDWEKPGLKEAHDAWLRREREFQ